MNPNSVWQAAATGVCLALALLHLVRRPDRPEAGINVVYPGMCLALAAVAWPWGLWSGAIGSWVDLIQPGLIGRTLFWIGAVWLVGFAVDQPWPAAVLSLVILAAGATGFFSAWSQALVRSWGSIASPTGLMKLAGSVFVFYASAVWWICRRERPEIVPLLVGLVAAAAMGRLICLMDSPAGLGGLPVVLFIGLFLLQAPDRSVVVRERSPADLLADLPFPALTHDRRGKITSVNKAFEELGGYRAEELVGRIWPLGRPKDDQVGLIDRSPGAPDKDPAWPEGLELVAKSGRRRRAAWFKIPWTDGAGRTEEIVWLGREVTDHYRAAQETEADRDRLRTALAQVSAKTIETALSRAETALNQATDRLDQLTGQRDRDQAKAAAELEALIDRLAAQPPTPAERDQNGRDETDPDQAGPEQTSPEPTDPAASEPPLTLAAAERRHIIAVLERADWKITGPNGAAEQLDVNPSTLRYRMKKLNITRP